MSGLSNLLASEFVQSASSSGTYAHTNNPGARLGASMTFSHDGRFLYLFGGSLHVASVNGNIRLQRPTLLADLWVFSFSEMQWAYLSGPLTWAVQGSAHARSTVATVGAFSRLQAPGARAYASMTADADGLVYVGYGMRLVLAAGTTLDDGASADGDDESCLDGTVFAVFAEQLHNNTWTPPTAKAQLLAPASHGVGSEVAAWAWLASPTAPFASNDDARLGASFLMLPNTVGAANAAYTNPSAILLRTGGLTYPTGAARAGGLTTAYPFFMHTALQSDADQSVFVALTSPCTHNPCANGGNCSVCTLATCLPTSPTHFVGMSTKSYKCICPAGFYGEHCEVTRAQYAPPTAPAVPALVCAGAGSTTAAALNAPCTCAAGTTGRLCSPVTARALVNVADGTPLPGAVPRFFAASATTHSLSAVAARALGLRAGATVTFIAGGTSGVDTNIMTAAVTAHSLTARNSVPIAEDRTHDATKPVLETDATKDTVAYTGQHMGASLVYYPQGNCLFLFGGIVSNGGDDVRICRHYIHNGRYVSFYSLTLIFFPRILTPFVLDFSFSF